MNDPIRKWAKGLIIPLILLLAILLFTARWHSYDSIGEFVSLENVRELSLFNGHKYVFSPEETEDVLAALNAIPLSKCRMTHPKGVLPPGAWQYQLAIIYEDGTDVNCNFLSNIHGNGIFEIRTTDCRVHRFSGKIVEEYNAFAEYAYALAGWEWNWNS